MSLSEQNRALIERVWPFDSLDWANETTRFYILSGTLNRLLDAARAEGVAALQQAGEPVAWRYRDAWGNWAYCQALDNSIGPSVNTEKQPLYASSLPQQTALVEQGVEKIIGPHEPAACGASAPAEALQLPGEDAIAEIIARYVGQHPFEEMAEDRRDLRDKVRTQDGYDVNEPTRSDCRDAAAVILGKVFPR